MKRFIAAPLGDGRWTVSDTYFGSNSGVFQSKEEAEADARLCNSYLENQKSELAKAGLMLSDLM